MVMTASVPTGSRTRSRVGVLTYLVAAAFAAVQWPALKFHDQSIGDILLVICLVGAGLRALAGKFRPYLPRMAVLGLVLAALSVILTTVRAPGTSFLNDRLLPPNPLGTFGILAQHTTNGANGAKFFLAFAIVPLLAVGMGRSARACRILLDGWIVGVALKFTRWGDGLTPHHPHLNQPARVCRGVRTSQRAYDGCQHSGRDPLDCLPCRHHLGTNVAAAAQIGTMPLHPDACRSCVHGIARRRRSSTIRNPGLLHLRSPLGTQESSGHSGRYSGNSGPTSLLLPRRQCHHTEAPSLGIEHHGVRRHPDSAFAHQAVADFVYSPIHGLGMSVIEQAHEVQLELLAAGGVLLLAGWLLITIAGIQAMGRVSRDPRLSSWMPLAGAIAAWIVAGFVENQVVDRYLTIPIALAFALARLAKTRPSQVDP